MSEGVRSGLALVLFVVLCLLAAAVGGLATASSVDGWYSGVNKPSWNPPNSVFAPVWTTLFVMMGVAAWMVWRQRVGQDTRTAFVLFGIQLLLNIGWSVIFFGLQKPGWAAVEIVVLWFAILATGVAFSRISKPGGWLMVPYLAWVTFATVLNFTIWQLNS